MDIQNMSFSMDQQCPHVLPPNTHWHRQTCRATPSSHSSTLAGGLSGSLKLSVEVDWPTSHQQRSGLEVRPSSTAEKATLHKPLRTSIGLRLGHLSNSVPPHDVADQIRIPSLVPTYLPEIYQRPRLLAYPVLPELPYPSQHLCLLYPVRVLRPLNISVKNDSLFHL